MDIERDEKACQTGNSGRNTEDNANIKNYSEQRKEVLEKEEETDFRLE